MLQIGVQFDSHVVDMANADPSFVLSELSYGS